MSNAERQLHLESIRISAELLVHRAAVYGVVLTIEQKPLTPLAMGHYETTVSVRPDRNSY